MNPQLQIESLFFSALERKTDQERSAWLDSACRGDADLRRQVDRLLRAHSSVGEFLARPAVEQLTGEFGLPDLVGSVQTGSDTEGHDMSPTVARGVTEAGEEGSTGELEFLEPTAKPGSLGRLGHYEVLEVLGHGGFGIVLRAHDERLEREVAIKVLAPQLAASSSARKRFLREARSSAKVRHENVIHVYAVEEQPLPFLVMEFIPGESLQQRLDRAGSLPAAEVVKIGKQIAAGLAAAHGTGLIHRDIKPGNILIEAGQHGVVKITDFGLARAADDASVTQSGILAGTPMFMSPEQALGEPLDQRADLFSLGSVLYAMCSGRPPFRSRSTLGVLRRVTDDIPQPIQELVPDVPTWLCDLITRLHAKNPVDRFASAQEVADLLASGGTPSPKPSAETLPRTPDTQSSAKPAKPIELHPSAAPTTAQFSSQHWVVAAAIALCLLIGLGFTEASGVTSVSRTVIRLFSPEGALIVEVDDPTVSVKIEGSDVVITGAGVQEIRLKPGRYTVKASKDGKVVRQELVTVTNRGRQVVRVSQEPPPAVAVAVSDVSETKAWEQSVAALPPAEQVKAVKERLQKLNPDFDGELVSTIEGEAVIGLGFSTEHVTDISPVRVLTHLRQLRCGSSAQGILTDLSPLAGLQLTELNVWHNPVADLSPLAGMKLVKFDCALTKVTDLSPLAGMPLLRIYCAFTPVSDLSPLRGAPLKVAAFEGTQAADLSPLAGMQLRSLSVGCNVTDLSPLAGLPLEELTCAYAERLSDLSPIKGLKLKSINLDSTAVTDVSPLAGMPLQRLNLSGTPVSDLAPVAKIVTLKGLFLSDLARIADLTPLARLELEEMSFGGFQADRHAAPLRAIATLTTINEKPAAEFWKQVDAGQTK